MICSKGDIGDLGKDLMELIIRTNGTETPLRGQRRA